MSMFGTVINGVVVLDNGHTLPEGARVTVVVAEPASEATTLGQRLLKLAGTVDDLPPDMAEQHDHYLHGSPKR